MHINDGVRYAGKTEAARISRRVRDKQRASCDRRQAKAAAEYQEMLAAEAASGLPEARAELGAIERALTERAAPALEGGHRWDDRNTTWLDQHERGAVYGVVALAVGLVIALVIVMVRYL